MRTLLLTGFEPFLKYPINPTKEIVEDLHGKKIGDYKIHSVVLPVTFKSAGHELLKHIEKLQPNGIVSLGLAGGRPQLTLERIAININDGPVDNDGHQPIDEEIIAGGPDGYFSTLPIRKMVNQLNKEGLPAKISNTAGAYVCNHVMYNALHYASQQQTQIPAGFIHLPSSHELSIKQGNIPSWSMEDLKKGISICLGVLAEY